MRHGGKFTSPTPIQMQAWPMIMTGKDVIGVAQTGSGKTLAFLLPAVMHIRNNRRRKKDWMPFAMVQAPTRELAMQIADEADNFGGGIQVGRAWGGVPRRSQEGQCQYAELIVGTPGRTMDFLSKGTIDLRMLTYMVLDEADRMLDMGFKPQVAKIFRGIRPTGRQVLMFTATWPFAVVELAKEFFKQSWLKVTIGALQTSANHHVTQRFQFCKGKWDKTEKMVAILNGEFKGKKTLIFVKTKRDADELVMELRKHRIAAASLHGGRDQHERTQIVEDFKRGKNLQVVVATDVAQRGLHVDDIQLVLNYDFANNIEDYVHRIGRTARQGRKGTSITLFDLRNDERHIEELKKVLVEAKQVVPPEFEGGKYTGYG